VFSTNNEKKNSNKNHHAISLHTDYYSNYEKLKKTPVGHDVEKLESCTLMVEFKQ
jgi:hypothetical protein